VNITIAISVALFLVLGLLFVVHAVKKTERSEAVREPPTSAN
jgi:hypothetical protein